MVEISLCTHTHERACIHTHTQTRTSAQRMMSLVKQKGGGKKSAETVSASVLSSEKTPLRLPCSWTVPALWTLEPLDYVEGV